MSDLLPCGFCGGVAELVDVFGWRVRCRDCSACHGVGYGLQSAAIAKWNARAPSPSPSAAVSEEAVGSLDEIDALVADLSIDEHSLRGLIHDQLSTVRKGLAAGVGGAGWVKTDTQRPADLTDVLAIWWQGEQCIAFLRDGVWWYRGNMGMKSANVPPTHWQPLPLPPRDGGR